MDLLLPCTSHAASSYSVLCAIELSTVREWLPGDDDGEYDEFGDDGIDYPGSAVMAAALASDVLTLRARAHRSRTRHPDPRGTTTGRRIVRPY